MEFTNRSGQQPAASAGAAHHSANGGKRQRGKWLRLASAVLLISVAFLVAALAVFVATGGGKAEKEHINEDKFQAVFLNGGQVYFGKIREMNSKYLTLDNIYYLRVNEQVQPDTNQGDNQQAQQNISLAKLGCELHGPEDKMVINHEQVTFWENLKDDGAVAKAITEFVKQNPDGQKCDTNTQS